MTETVEVEPDTSGFYKDEGGELSFAPNFIYFPDKSELHRSKFLEYTYPVHGWYWFASDAEAIAALGVGGETL